MLTGDLNLKSKKISNKFFDYFKHQIDQVCVFQIPHHGSKYNWKDDIIDKLKNVNLFVFNYGKNPHKHPDYHIMELLIDKDKNFDVVNEFKPINYFFWE